MAYNVGDVVTLDGIESVIIYDAGSEQEWGRYIVTDRFYNLSHYTQNSDNFYNLHWLSFFSVTGITSQEIGDGLSNTNQILSLETSTENNTLTYNLNLFRSQHSDKWFVPSAGELQELITNSDTLYNLYQSNTYYNYEDICSSTEIDSNSIYKAVIPYKDISVYGNKIIYNMTSNIYRLCRYTTDEELSKTIQITTTTPDSQIQYTINDTISIYSSPFKLTANQEIKAIAKKEGYIDSDETDFIYNSQKSFNEGETYNISYVESDRCDISINKTQAHPGEKIIVTMTAHSGQTFWGWSASYNENKITVSQEIISNNPEVTEGSFIMPNGNAVVDTFYNIN